MVLALAGLVPSEWDTTQPESAGAHHPSPGLQHGKKWCDFSEPPLQPVSSGTLCFPGKEAF